MQYNSVQEIIDACYQYQESHLEVGERWGKPYRFYHVANSKYGRHQWLWDSGWHMICWSYRNPQNAIADLRTMLQFQQPDGFIPEVIHWGEKNILEKLGNRFFGYSNSQYTDLTQMPMLPYSLRAIWNATQDKEFLKEYVPKMVHYFDWWAKTRDPDHDGLVSIIHPWESGIDASPLYDPAHNVVNPTYGQLYPKFIKLQMKYRLKYHWNIAKILDANLFNFEDVGVCSVYAAGWGELGRLAQIFDSKLADHCFKEQDRFESAILTKCWDPVRKQFISYYHQGTAEKISFMEAHQELFPLLLDKISKEQQDAILAKLTDPKLFWAKYPVPSMAMNDITFNPNQFRLLWRGPLWPSTTWFVCEGLFKHGHTKILNEIVDRWIDLYKTNGIWEYYNPLTGKGEGEEGLGMSTVIVDMIYRLKKI
jgi:glycogen debranching enzyme